MNSNLSRKKFLKLSALGATGAAFTVNPLMAATGKAVQTSTAKTAPSDIVNIALIGCGAQGPGVARSHMGLSDVRCIAGCDVYGFKRTRFQKTVEDFYAPKGISTKGFKVYENFEDLMLNKDVDAVIIATPDHWHSLIGVAACQAGKDIYVEKPMAFTVFEGEQLVKAVRKYSRIMQTGSMQRSMPTFEQMAKIARSGVLGKISTIYAPVGDPPHDIDYPEQPVPADLNWNKWLGPLSTKFYYNDELDPVGSGWGGWRWHKGLGGGYTTDWGAHMFDCAQWAIGKDRNGPITVIPPEESKYKKLTYVYDNGIEMIQAFDPWDGSRGNSVKIYGENGWIFASRSAYYCSNPAWSRDGQDDTKMPPPPPPRTATPPAATAATAPAGTAPTAAAAAPAAPARPAATAPASTAPAANAPAATAQAGAAQAGGFVAGVSRDGNEVNQKHYRSFIDGIKSRIDPNTPVEIGQSSAVVCNIGNIAYDLKRTLRWNPLIDRFMGDDEANNHRIMKYAMRAPYQIDNI
jgi:predicted dehydrogenase